jgi:hypothetical protein
MQVRSIRFLTLLVCRGYKYAMKAYSMFIFSIVPADTDIPADWSTFPPRPPHVQCATPARIRKLYRDQLAVPEYQSLLKQNITIFGTIDG